MFDPRRPTVLRIEDGLYSYELGSWTEQGMGARVPPGERIDDAFHHRLALRRALIGAPGSQLRALLESVGQRFIPADPAAMAELLSTLADRRVLVITRRPRPIFTSDLPNDEFVREYELAEQSGIRRWVSLALESEPLVAVELGLELELETWPGVSTDLPGWREPEPLSLTVEHESLDTELLLTIEHEIETERFGGSLLEIEHELEPERFDGSSLEIDHELDGHQLERDGGLALDHELGPEQLDRGSPLTLEHEAPTFEPLSLSSDVRVEPLELSLERHTG